MRTVCEAIWRRLGPLVMPEPSEDVWKSPASKIQDLWHFPNCLASINGKHISIQCPIIGGALYFDYKEFHSTVLLALIDAEYKFLAIDVDSYGKISDGNIFSKSVIGTKLETGTLNVPPNMPYVENAVPVPYVIVGDGMFSPENIFTSSIQQTPPRKRQKQENLQLSIVTSSKGC